MEKVIIFCNIKKTNVIMSSEIPYFNLYIQRSD